MAENPTLTDEEQDKENSPPLPITPLSERPIQTPVLMRSRPFGTETENVPEYVFTKLFEIKFCTLTVYVFQNRLFLSCFSLS